MKSIMVDEKIAEKTWTGCEGEEQETKERACILPVVASGLDNLSPSDRVV